MAMKPRSIGLGLFGAVLVAGLLTVAFRKDPVPVDLHEVALAPMQITVDADGKTRIRDVWEVAAPIAGTAQRAPVRVGDPVAKGTTVVARVEPGAPSLLDARSRVEAEAGVREAEAALHVAATELNKAGEDRAFALSQFERVRTLRTRGVATETQLEDASQRLNVAKAAEEAAQARLDMAGGTLQRARAALIAPDPQAGNGACCVDILAPADGVVLQVDTISERPVIPGMRLLSIGDPDDLEIVADLLSADAVRLTPGARAMVDRWGGDRMLEARLVRIEPAARTRVSALGIEEQRVDAIFDLASPPEARAGLGDGFAVFLRIVEWEAGQALQVPLSALFRRGDDWAVFVAQDGVAVERRVVPGRRNQRMAEVLDGLQPGDLVVTHPGDTVTAGVRLVERAP